jgi:hypothetical protein
MVTDGDRAMKQGQMIGATEVSEPQNKANNP